MSFEFNKEIEPIYFLDEFSHRVHEESLKKAYIYDDKVRLAEGYDGLVIDKKLDLKRLITWLQHVYDNCEDV